MDVMIICEIISAVGVVLSAVVAAIISIITSRRTAEAEIRQLEMSWNREDSQSLQQKYLSMIEAVSAAAGSPFIEDRQLALGKIATVRPYYSGKKAELLDELYNLLNREQIEPRQVAQTLYRLSSDKE